MDKIERRTWRSPFSEGLPSGCAGGCTGATQEHLLDRKGWLYLFNEKNIKIKTSEADLSLWKHCVQVEPQQFPRSLYRAAGECVPLAQLQPVSNCKEFSTSSLDPELSYPFPIKKSISLNTIPSLLYLLEKYGLVFLLSTCVRGTDSSVKKQNFSIRKKNQVFCCHISYTISALC